MIDKYNKDQHLFAFFCPQTTEYGTYARVGDLLRIDDQILNHRIMHVLRLDKGESFTLFDSHKHLECTFEQVDGRSIYATVHSYRCNDTFAPHITFMLPLLKKEAFEESLYTLTELGANTIQLFTSKKTQRVWGGQKEDERTARIMQAAAEQSKNFAFPKLCSPAPLETVVNAINHDTIKIFFDPEGCHLNNVITSINTSLPTHIVLAIGPEGDLTTDEKAYLNSNGFVFCQLTKTILRSRQAVAVSMGALRSLLHF